MLFSGSDGTLADILGLLKKSILKHDINFRMQRVEQRRHNVVLSAKLGAMQDASFDW